MAQEHCLEEHCCWQDDKEDMREHLSHLPHNSHGTVYCTIQDNIVALQL